MAPPDPRLNHLLAALPVDDYTRLVPQLELVPLPLATALYEPGTQLAHVYFPTNSIVSLLYVMDDEWRNTRWRTKSMMNNIGYNGLLGLLVLIGDVWAIINIFQSSVSNEKKLIWIVAVVLLPVLGLILWYFLGPRGR